ncbi:hypothetical protein [Ichthyenterobacterium magnum]|uniref:Uncharacterized protein n=1 Tax=Ichthyenterobacterium magnum TaxID=1230530 RepID=A0A420DXA7_9FLAO|nr:hypothetical protein [Ichthyenterobacterium magnum]RKE98855.1 hypothetical protein BXY80_0950 [Ichthyenterobacterium magnum]
MKKLSKDNIQFIENYLENSDVLYADIRMEMTDHVASAIEEQMQTESHRDFYFVFKDYMVENKARLLENNKQFLKNVDKSIARQLFRQILKLTTLFVFVFSFLVVYKLINYIEKDQLRNIVILFPMLSTIPFLVLYGLSLKIFRLPRFSGIERLSFVYLIFFQVLNFVATLLGNYIKTNTNDSLVALCLALIITVSTVVMQLTFTIIKQYRRDYKFVN